MPSTIRRSAKRAQDIYVKTHDSAAEQYGEGQRVHRTAFKAVKRVPEIGRPLGPQGPYGALGSAAGRQ